MTREQVAEREVVLARLEVEGVRQEVPAGEFLGAGSAAGAVTGNGFLGGGLGDEAHVELVESDLANGLSDGYAQTAREQSASRVAWVAIADQRRRLNQNLELGRRLCELLLAQAFLGAARASQAAALVLAMVSVRVDEMVHIEG